MRIDKTVRTNHHVRVHGKTCEAVSQRDLEITRIPLSALQPFKANPALRTSEARLREIQKSVGENGIKVPLAVVAMRNGKFEVGDGNRRFIAAKALKLTHAPCIVYHPLVKDQEDLVVQALFLEADNPDEKKKHSDPEYVSLCLQTGVADNQRVERSTRRVKQVKSFLTSSEWDAFLRADRYTVDALNNAWRYCQERYLTKDGIAADHNPPLEAAVRYFRWARRHKGSRTLIVYRKVLAEEGISNKLIKELEKAVQKDWRFAEGRAVKPRKTNLKMVA
jgi:hypothetical protein